ncbi:MAG TPA: D-alanine--D-alanine ligase family protein [Mycobacteriales bacterium]|nr:D-alanine--D-alanine ligase family protein [Mycobacteriales bacterium]
MPGHRSPRKPRVAVVFGGRSTEHAISCLSAGSVLPAIDRSRYDVVALGISPEGRWVLAPGDADTLRIRDGELPAVSGERPALALCPDPTAGRLLVHEPTSTPPEPVGVDVVFPLLHGPYGEDGTIQGLFEMAGVPYVGSGVLASAAAMDKEFMKLTLAARGLPVGRYVVVRERDWHDDRSGVLRAVEGLGLPVFVKPARGGSSVGISKVSRLADVAAAVETARAHDPKVLVEQAVTGREIECGVLAGVDGGPPEASVPAEIRVTGGREFYDFEAKYLDSATALEVPADVPDVVTKRVQELACRAFEALDCEGLARVDFFLTADEDLLVNEVNTMPGFTPSSMFPRMWAASGVDYRSLVDRLLRDALSRRPGLR